MQNIESKRAKQPNHVMNVTESNHFLADVLRTGGIDIYKIKREELKEMKGTITLARSKIDSLLRKHYNTSLIGLDSLSSGELQNIRESFLSHYYPELNKAEKLKKWIPLSQIVGYIESIMSCSFRKLNISIDNYLISKSSISPNLLEYTRIKIVNAMKRKNQGASWEDIDKEIFKYIGEIGTGIDTKTLNEWKDLFDNINSSLQELYAKYSSTGDVNQDIRDLYYRETKKSPQLQHLVDQTTKKWKPANIEHDIHSQSQEVNRSLVEAICNSIDASTHNKKVFVTINENGYQVQDFGIGMNPYVILEKLLVPKISGKTGNETIGRFGVGFYTELSHLETEQDFARTITSDGNKKYISEFRKHERTGDIFLNMDTEDISEQDLALETGTTVTVNAENFDKNDAEKLCKDIFEFNNNCAIYINGVQINPMENVSIIPLSDKTSLKFIPEISQTSHAVLSLGGVKIESFDFQGIDVLKTVVLDFPLTCSLAESRSELAIDIVSIQAISHMLDTVLASDIDDLEKIAFCNTVALIATKLQARSRSNKNECNINLQLKHRISEYFKNSGKILLPAIYAYKALDLDNVIYINDTGLTSTTDGVCRTDSICATNLEDIPGIERCPSFFSYSGHKLYIADFKPEIEDFLVKNELDKILIIRRDVYDKHKNCPATLNAYLTNLNNSPSLSSYNEKNLGEIGMLNIVDEENVHFSRDILTIFFEYSGVDDYYHFVNLPESQQRKILKEDVLSRIIIREPETNEIPLIDEGRKKAIMEKVIRIFSEYPFEEWEDCIERIRTKENVEIFYGSPELRAVFRQSKIIKQHYSFTQFFINWVSDDDSMIDKDVFIVLLHKLFDISKLDELRKTSEDDVYDFLSFFAKIVEEFIGRGFYDARDTIYSASKKVREIMTRMQSLFFDKMHSFNGIENEEFITGFAKISQNLWEDNPESNYPNYSVANRDIRGYLLYVFEGGELLYTKDKDHLSQQNYDYEVSLSKLVQAKQDNEAYFQAFSGTPNEIFGFVKESQKGIDSTKAMRDINHSVKNQIVNNPYLWIREILKNAFEAVKENKEQFTETPVIQIDAFLRIKNNKEELVIEARDPVGMDLHTIINYLLIPNESSKGDNEEGIVKIGDGFFTIFHDAREVLIKTSKGNGRVEYLKIIPIKDADGEIMDYSISISEKEENFKGSIMQKVVNTDSPQIEAAFCKNALSSYGALINRNLVQLKFRDQEINQKQEVLAQTLVPDFGHLTIYKSREGTITQDALYVKDIDRSWMHGVPEYIINYCIRLGVAIDIPSGIKLIRSRCDLARKAEIMPILHRYLPVLLVQSSLRYLLEGNYDYSDINGNYFMPNYDKEVEPNIRQDAETLLGNRPLQNYETYLQDKGNSFNKLATILPIFYLKDKNKYVSLYEFSQRINIEDDNIDINSLPHNIKKKIQYAQSKMKKKCSNDEKSPDEISTNNSHSGYNELSEDILKQQFPNLSIFNSLVQGILQSLGKFEINHAYYSETDTSLAHAIHNESIEFNIANMDWINEPISKIITSGSDSLSYYEVKDFLKKVIVLVSQALTHNEYKRRGNDIFANGHSFDSDFFKLQRDIIKQLIFSNINFADIINNITSVRQK